MDVVKQFNQELSSLYEIKPPISKAKMTAITKGAIRAIKYYKHVVQSVEKFIQKCRPEYKIPGLYVIDSIVRQSRHQFGADKDVFAGRFARNIRLTFYNLYKCTEEEKSKVIRVLNLWQKNEVFQSDVIQPLFDLANPNSELSKQMDEQAKRGALAGSSGSDKKTPLISVAAETQMQGRSGKVDEDQQIIQQLQTIQQLLKNHLPSNSEVKFNKKLLDFDYSDDEDGGGDGGDGRPTAAMLEVLQSILCNDRMLQKLKSMGEITDHQIQQLQQLIPQAQQQLQQPQPSAGQPFLRVSTDVSMFGPPPSVMDASGQPGGFFPYGTSYPMGGAGDASQVMQMWGQASQPLMVDDIAEDDIQILEDRSAAAAAWRREARRHSRSRSGSRERRRAGRGRRSRSRSRDRSGRRRRSRSRSPRDRKESERDKEKDKEKRREREKKGLPPMKRNCLSVCSTTLWVGHLSKLVGDEDLSDVFGEFGAIESINLIPPRGCAFICMNRRQDAARALKELNKTKIHGKPITIAWAPGKCMKEKQWKDYWDVDVGVSFIPLEKIDASVNLNALEEGGMIDEETMPDWMRHARGLELVHEQQHQQHQQFVADLNKMAAAGVAAAAAAAGAPPGFVGLPSGMSPALGPGPGHDPSSGLSLPPPFGLPPGLAQAGMLPGPGVLQGAGLLGAPGVARLVGPPGLLLPPRFPLGQPPPLGHNFPPPGFDISQPPPGLRPPFMPPTAAAPVPISDAGSDDMDIDQDVTSSHPPPVLGDRVRGGGDQQQRRERNRESRWNRDDRGPQQQPPPQVGDRDESLVSRLRTLAGIEGQVPLPEKKDQDWDAGREQRGGPGPFGNAGGGRFGGPPQAGGRFGGPFGEEPGFNNGNAGSAGFPNGGPFNNGGPTPGGPFRDGPPAFGATAGNEPFGMRGGIGGGNFWRGGRGGPRGGGAGQRGGFNNRGVWNDEGPERNSDGFDGLFNSGQHLERDSPWAERGGGRGGRGGWRGNDRGGSDLFERNVRGGEFGNSWDRRGGRDGPRGQDFRERSADERERDRDRDRETSRDRERFGGRDRDDDRPRRRDDDRSRRDDDRSRGSSRDEERSRGSARDRKSRWANSDHDSNDQVENAKESEGCTIDKPEDTPAPSTEADAEIAEHDMDAPAAEDHLDSHDDVRLAEGQKATAGEENEDASDNRRRSFDMEDERQQESDVEPTSEPESRMELPQHHEVEEEAADEPREQEQERQSPLYEDDSRSQQTYDEEPLHQEQPHYNAEDSQPYASDAAEDSQSIASDATPFHQQHQRGQDPAGNEDSQPYTADDSQSRDEGSQGGYADAEVPLASESPMYSEESRQTTNEASSSLQGDADERRAFADADVADHDARQGIYDEADRPDESELPEQQRYDAYPQQQSDWNTAAAPAASEPDGVECDVQADDSEGDDDASVPHVTDSSSHVGVDDDSVADVVDDDEASAD